MKKIINIILGVCIAGLVYILVESIMAPIRFDELKTARDNAVINRLIDIRSAQIEYANQHKSQYTADFDELIEFVKVAKLPLVSKVGELTDAQLDDEWTTPKVMELYYNAKHAASKKEADKLWKEAEEAGLVKILDNGEIEYYFNRDTTWVDMIDSVYKRDNFCPDSLRYVPFTDGIEFEMATGTDTTKSGTVLYLFEAKTLYKNYLKGLDKQEVINLIDECEQLDRYPGMKVGSIEGSNNNAGNWE
ncbi:MAG: hypothetical protein MJY71_04330 [Bacteroidaceae bacterium]|nr:hypothetical protein [Bacteroidaceae bacterium]